MTDTAAVNSNGSDQDLAPVVVPSFKRGYLPAQTRLDPDKRVMINRFPLGDIDNFSVSRAALAHSQTLLGKSYDYAWLRDAPWEKAYYEALREVEFKAAQSENVSGQDGGFLAPEVWSGPYISMLRAFSVFDQLPVTKLTVPARLAHIPKVTGDVTMTYPQENAGLTNTGFLLGQVSYTARKATHLIPISNELIRDAGETADQLLRKESALAHALDRDTQLLVGQGGMNPTGLITLATNGTVSKYYAPATSTASIAASATHGTPSFLHISQLRGKVHQLNGITTFAKGQAHCNGMIVHSRFEQTVLTLAAAAGPWTDAQGRPIWMQGLSTRDPGNLIADDQSLAVRTTRAPHDSLMGQSWVLTNIVPIDSIDGGGSASSFVIAGWWDMYVLFESNAFQFDTSIDATFSSNQTLIRAVHRFDGGPARPEAFAVLAGCDQ